MTRARRGGNDGGRGGHRSAHRQGALVRGLVDELTSELSQHRRIAIPVGSAVLVVILAIGVAAVLDFAGAVATLAVLAMVGTAVGVLLFTAHSAGRLRR